MSIAITNLPLDKSGRNPNNLVVAEKQTLEPMSDYRCLVLNHGGFYGNDLALFDEEYNQLALDRDYILTYYHKDTSEYIGLDIYSLVVVINPEVSSLVMVTAQMVGGDAAYTFTAKDDYLMFLASKLEGYVPSNKDYYGNEPVYHPGELQKLRWHLDTYQPFNKSLYMLSRSIMGFIGHEEDNFRDFVDDQIGNFIDGAGNTIGVHIKDKDDPHQVTKLQVGLGNLANFPVATLQQAIDGLDNNCYMTPALAWAQFELFGSEALNQHTQNTNNPHNVTIAQFGGLANSLVIGLANTKYNRTETVANTTRGYYFGYKTYSQMLTEFKRDLPAENFTSGKVTRNIMAPGTPNRNTAIVSYPYQWTDFSTLLSNSVFPITNQIYRVNWNSTGGRTKEQIHSSVMSSYRGAPVYAAFMYRVKEPWYWYDDETVPSGFQFFTHASHRTSVGAAWAMAHA